MKEGHTTGRRRRDGAVLSVHPALKVQLNAGNPDLHMLRQLTASLPPCRGRGRNLKCGSGRVIEPYSFGTLTTLDEQDHIRAVARGALCTGWQCDDDEASSCGTARSFGLASAVLIGCQHTTCMARAARGVSERSPMGASLQVAPEQHGRASEDDPSPSMNVRVCRSTQAVPPHPSAHTPHSPPFLTSSTVGL